MGGIFSKPSPPPPPKVDPEVERREEQLEAQEKLMKATMVELTSKIKLLDAFVE